jgi:hypothetical protein
VHLPRRFLGTHLGTRLGALGLLRGGRLSLHLPLGVLRRGGNLSAGAVHGAWFSSGVWRRPRLCHRKRLAVAERIPNYVKFTQAGADLFG